MYYHPKVGVYETWTDMHQDLNLEILRDNLSFMQCQPEMVDKTRGRLSLLVDLFSKSSGYVPNHDQVPAYLLELEQKATQPIEKLELISMIRDLRLFPIDEVPLPSVEVSDFVADNQSPPGLTAKVACVLEPLKVRTLTKCEAVPTYLCKPLQKRIWSGLQELEMFKLTGRVVEPTDITDVLNKGYNLYKEEIEEKEPLCLCKQFKALGFESDQPDSEDGGVCHCPPPIKKELRWVSGDYSRATDELNPYLSQWVLDRILSHLQVPKWYKSIARRMLGNHCINYDNTEFIDQQRGQLMGSIISFGFLCILNLLTLADHKMMDEVLSIKKGRKSRKYSVKRLRNAFNKLPLLINGDDILFPILSDWEFQAWTDRHVDVGFSLSPGKNLVSKHFVTINTTLFQVKESKDLPQPNHEPVDQEEDNDQTQPISDELVGDPCRTRLNFNINDTGFGYAPCGGEFDRKDKDECSEQNTGHSLNNKFIAEKIKIANLGHVIGQSKVNSRDSKYSPLSVLHNNILEDSGNNRFLQSEFMRYHKKQLEHASQNGSRNYFLSLFCGGNGLNGTPLKITDAQKAVASVIIRNHKKAGLLEDKIDSYGIKPEDSVTGFTFTKSLCGPKIVMRRPTDVLQMGEKRTREIQVGPINGQPQCDPTNNYRGLFWQLIKGQQIKMTRTENIINYPRMLVPVDITDKLNTNKDICPDLETYQPTLPV
jgi:hypothetical protein